MDLLDPTHPLFAGQSPARTRCMNASTATSPAATRTSRARTGTAEGEQQQRRRDREQPHDPRYRERSRPSVDRRVRRTRSPCSARTGSPSPGTTRSLRPKVFLAEPCPNANVGDSFVVVDIAPAPPTIVATLRNSSLPAPWAGSRRAEARDLGGGLRQLRVRHGRLHEPVDRHRHLNPLNPTIVASPRTQPTSTSPSTWPSRRLRLRR